MAVARVLDFPGGTQEQYEEVVERMQLGGRMAPGGKIHVAGTSPALRSRNLEETCHTSWPITMSMMFSIG